MIIAIKQNSPHRSARFGENFIQAFLLLFMGIVFCFLPSCQSAEKTTEVVVAQRTEAEAQQHNDVEPAVRGPSEQKKPVVMLTGGQTADKNPIDGERAFGFLERICALGPRITGSDAMKSQQQLLAKHFNRLEGNVRMQGFRFPHPLNGSPTTGTNMIVEWHPDRKDRILICVHYDTRPQGDNPEVPRHQRGDIFLGANDGASGAALLMELAYQMPKLESRYGVDFLLVDAEEYVFSNSPRARYFWGSEFFARDYVQNPPEYRYRKGVVLDMIGDRHLQIYQDRNSVWWRDTRPVTQEIWAVAKKLGVKEFIPRTHPKMRVPIRDDHLMLHNIGKIPTCEIIDFDYPKFPVNRYWHTADDTPDRCSGTSLAKVGWVMLEWLRTTD